MQYAELFDAFHEQQPTGQRRAIFLLVIGEAVNPSLMVNRRLVVAHLQRQPAVILAAGPVVAQHIPCALDFAETLSSVRLSTDVGMSGPGHALVRLLDRRRVTLESFEAERFIEAVRLRWLGRCALRVVEILTQNRLRE